MNARASDVLSVGQIGELLDEYLALDALKNDELYGELSAIKTRLVVIAIIADKPDDSDEQSTSLCNDLRKWMDVERFARIQKDGIKFNTVLFSAALTLAKINPVNTIDAITQLAIEPKDIVHTSDRFQHDINNLIKWLQGKTTNPWTNLALHRFDLARIKVIMQEEVQNAQPTSAVSVVDSSRQNLFHHWVASPASARLPNGNYAASGGFHGEQVHIIDVAQNNTVINFYAGYPVDRTSRIGAIKLLSNGHLVIGYAERNHDIVVINPETCEEIQSFRNAGSGIDNTDLMTVKGNNIITVCGTRNQFNIHDTVTGTTRTMTTSMQIHHILDAGVNGLAIIGYENTNGIVEFNCSIYDDRFTLINQFDWTPESYSGCEDAVTLLQNGNVVFAIDHRLEIYDHLTGQRVQQFEMVDSMRIECMAVLDNGNILVIDSTGEMREYTQTGAIVNEVRIEIHRGERLLRHIGTQDALLLAYQQLARTDRIIPHPARTQISTNRRPLPNWVGSREGVRLNNGYFAVVRDQFERGHGCIRIINPANDNHVVREMLFSRPIGAIGLLENGNIVIGFNRSSDDESNRMTKINIYNPLTGERVESCLNHVGYIGGPCLMITKGNNVIVFDIGGKITEYNTLTGNLVRSIDVVMYIKRLLVRGNELAVIGCTPENRWNCSIYDENGRLKNSFVFLQSLLGPNAAMVLPDGKLALAFDKKIKIYDIDSGTFQTEFESGNMEHVFTLSVLENGNLLVGGEAAKMNEYTVDGTFVRQVHANIQTNGFIQTFLLSDTLKYAYEKLTSVNTLRSVPTLFQNGARPNEAMISTSGVVERHGLSRWC